MTDELKHYVIKKLEAIRGYDSGLLSHCTNVSVLSCLISRELDMTYNDQWNLFIAGALHDYGKLFVDREILDKPARLTRFEYDLVKSHVIIGYRTLEDERMLNRDVLDLILEHHERVGGNGYPSGELDVSEGGKILAVSDVFEALTAQRCYRDGIPDSDAVEILRNEKMKEEIVVALEKVLKSDLYHACHGSTWEQCECLLCRE